MRMLNIYFLILFSVLFEVSFSSWLACSDYTEKNGEVWDPQKCRGFPRNAATYAQKSKFGFNLGFEHRPNKPRRTCKTNYKPTSYSNEYPLAVYYPGQQVVLAHPMKGHGAASCSDKWTPDHGSKVLRGRRRKDKNRFYDFYNQTVVADLGASLFGDKNKNPDTYPKPGYQNAPKFCEDKDKSLATYSFNVPEDIEPGFYTFVWSWAFRSPTDIFTTCFDVKIAANKADRDSRLQAQSSSINLSVSCGGFTSGGEKGSIAGCDLSKNNETATQQTTRHTTTQKILQSTSTLETTQVSTTEITTPQTTLQETTPKVLEVTSALETTQASTTEKPTDQFVTIDSATIPKVMTTQVTSSSLLTTSKVLFTNQSAKQQQVSLNGYQLSGEIKLGVPPLVIKERIVEIKFHCGVEAVKFYNAVVMKEDYERGSYKVKQDKFDEVRSGKIDFFVSFQDCQLKSHQIRAMLSYESF